MRPIYLLGISLLLTATVSAQVGIGTEQPNLHAVLDLRSPSDDQGFLAPRVTTLQRTASSFTTSLTTDENGLLVFDTDDKIFYYWMFPAWRAIEAGSTNTVWRSGMGVPADALGEENDFYLDAATSDVYRKSSGAYVLVVNIKGEKGDKGDKGDPGATGAVGPMGTQGPQGLQGIQGLKGDKGDQGDPGVQGLQGIQGLQGLKGDKGDKGDPGIQGIPGLQGVQGEKGDPGAQGLQGIQGLKGDKGDKGDQGIQGLQGIQGEKGDTGPQGLQGIQGLKGDQGDPGAQGIQGNPGLKGDQGDAGPQGIQGIQGLKGDPGLKGDKGDIGATGATGPAGPIGPQGPPGPQGTTGAQGPQGLPGRSTLNIREVPVSDKAYPDKDDILIGTGADVTIQLPPAASMPGKVFYFRLGTTDSKQLTIVRDGLDTIITRAGTGVNSISLDATMSGVTLVSDGKSRWFVIASF